MTNIIQDPNPEKATPEYSQEFLDALESDFNTFKSEGYSQDQIQEYMNEQFRVYNENHAPSDVSYEEKPEWADSARIEMKNTTKKRGLINRIGRALKMSIDMVPAPTSYGVGFGVKYSNPLRDAGKEDVDVISSDMITDTDGMVKTMLYDEDGNRDTSIDVKEHVEATRSVLAEKYNPKGHRTQSTNNEILMEESYSEVIASSLEKRFTDMYKEFGISKKDLLLGDPKELMKIKKELVKDGYTGRMADRALDKTLYDDKREILAGDFDDTLIKSHGKDVEKNKDQIGSFIYNSANERAVNLFNPEELERMTLNLKLNELIKSGGDDADRENLEAQIAVLDSALGYDSKERAAKTGVAYQGALFMPGAMASPGVMKVGTDEWERDVIYRMYDKDFKKIMRGDESKEEIAHQQLVTSELQNFAEIKSLPDRLLQEMLKSEKILLNLNGSKDRLNSIFREKGLDQTLEAYNIKGPEAEYTAKEKDAIGGLFQHKRTIGNINEEILSETARFEAVSRMYLLNQNVALEDKNIKNYMGLYAATIRDINIKPFLNNPNPSVEQVRAVVDPIYADLGIEKDSEEYEKTAPDIINEIMIGSAHMTDIALKMSVMGASGGNYINQFLSILGRNGSMYKFGAEVFKMALEEGKFQIVGGNKGTGAAFYVANKAFPTVKTKKPWLDVIWNGFMKGSVGMTVAMEGSHQMEVAWKAAVNDDDVIRAMTETFGTIPEAKRRIFVELITASPFGIKGMVERGALPSVTPKSLSEQADYLEKNGQPEIAAEFRSLAATLGDSKVLQKTWDTMYKVDVLRENDPHFLTKDMKLSDINEAYEKLMGEEGQVDVLKNKKVAVHLKNKYFNPKVAFDGAEYAGKIDRLQKEGIPVEKLSPRQLEQKYADIIGRSNAHMLETRAGVEPNMETSNLATPNKRKKVQPRKHEMRIKESYNGIDSIKKDTQWNKKLKGPAKNVANVIRDLKKEIPTEIFDEILTIRAGLKGGTSELDAMVTSLFDAKSKEVALETVSKIEDIVHKVEVETRPEADKLEYVTRTPSQSDSKISQLTNFRNNISAYKRGQADGRRDLSDKMDEIYKFIKERVTPRSVKQIMTKQELKTLTKPLPKNATQKQTLEKLEKIDFLFEKLEKRADNLETAVILNRNKPKKTADKMTQTKLGEIGGSMMSVANMLFTNNTKAAKHAIAKLVEIYKGAESGSHKKVIAEAEINALRYTGNRELALERQAELESIQAFERKLTLAEKNEYTLLNMVDFKQMNRIDALRALETVKEIERTGRTVNERAEQFRNIKKTVDMHSALEALNVKAEAIEGIEQINRGKSFKENLKGALNKYTSAQESFISMMEMLSANDPARDTAWEGFFHTISKDLHRSRERQMADHNKFLNQMFEDLTGIYDMKSRPLNKRLKQNTKKAYPFITPIAERVQGLKGGVTIDQAATWWKWLHNEATWKLFGKGGFGVEGDKFEKKQADKLMSEIEKFVESNTGDLKDIDAAKYQMEKYTELYRYVNDMYSREHGVDLGYTVNYTPVIFERGVKYNSEGIETDLGSYTDILKGNSEFFVKTASPVFTKATTFSGNIKLDLSIGGEKVFNDYLSAAMHYRHFQEPIKRAKNIFENKEIQNAIEAKFGTKFVNTAINTAIGDIAADHTTKMGGLDQIPLVTKIKNNFVMANLGANLILFPKQMMSVDAYRAGLKTTSENLKFQKYLMSVMIDGWGTMGELNNSEFMFNRAAGNTMNRELVEMRKQARKMYKNGKLKPGDLRETMLFMTKLGDRLAILVGGQAFYRTKLDTYKSEGLSENLAKRKSYEDFVTFTKLTQQSGNIEDLGHIQRWGTLGKYATLFQNTPQQYLRIEMAAVRNFKNERQLLMSGKQTAEQRAASKAKMSRAARDFVVYHFVLPMTFRAASQGFYLGGDDKGRGRFVDDEGQLVTAILGSLSYAFALGDMATNAFSLGLTGHAFETQIGGVAQDVVSGVQKSFQIIQEMAGTEEFKLEWNRIMDGTSPINWADILNVLGAVGEVSGMPVRSPVLLAKGITDYRNNKTDDIRSWFGYSAGVTGHYERSPQAGLIHQYLGFDSVKGKDLLMKRLIKETDPDYFKNNSDRIMREYDMYKHFGMYNEDVNYLYTTARNNREKARYLRAMRDGKSVKTPISLADLARVIGEPMSPETFERYMQTLLKYGVITKEVQKEMIMQDQDIKKKMVLEFRKAVD